jgi:hypothetical protein
LNNNNGGGANQTFMANNDNFVTALDIQPCEDEDLPVVEED